MYSDNYCEKAIPLISVNESTGKYEMTAEANKFLRSVPAPMGVVSVAGLYRTGKSYLLNKMLLNAKAKQGFGVGPTINPCTKGLWCWGTPIKGKSQTGESINIIVIDTEGIGALDEDQTHDTKIFTLAILASSCFIYNSQGSIDETAIQNLRLVVDLTKHIQLRSSDKNMDYEEDSEEISGEFPTFYWVVRDFSLQLQDKDGKEITSKQYLEKALAPINASNQFDEDVEEKNKIRKILTSFFKDRDCFTMVRPLVDETRLQDLDSVIVEDLRPDFVDQVHKFRQRVLTGMKVKALNNKSLTGDMYSNMLSSYIGAINDGAIPNIENAWNYMCQEQCQKVQDESEGLFDKEMRDNLKLPVEEDYFDSTCEHAMDSAMSNFREKAVGEPLLLVKYERELKEKIKEKIKTSRDENIKLSKEFLQKRVIEAFQPITEQLKKQHFKNFEEFERTISGTYENLINTTKNVPMMKQKFLELYKKVQKQGAEYMFKCLNKQTQNMKFVFEEKEAHYKKEIQMMSDAQDNDRKIKSEQFERMDREKIEMEKKIEKLEFEIEKMVKDRKDETEHLEKKFSHKHSEFESLKITLEERVTTLQMNYEDVSKKLSREQKEWEMNKQIMENMIKQQKDTIATLERDCQSITTKYEETKSQSNQFHRETVSKNERRIGEMDLEIKKLKEERFEEEQTFKDVKEELEERIQKFERNQKRIKEELLNKKRDYENLKNEFEAEKKKFEQELEDERDRNNRSKNGLSEESKKQKESIAALNEELRKVKIDSENKVALIEQKMEFIEEEKKFLKTQIEEMKFNHEKALQDLRIQSGQQIQQREQIRIQEVKTEYISQIKSVEVRYEAESKKFMFENENLRNQNEAMTLELKLAVERLNSEKQGFDQMRQEMSEKITMLESQVKNVERNKEEALYELQNLLKRRAQQLENELQEVKEKAESELKASEESKKEAIVQLRHTYENQKQQMESYHSKQRLRLQKKYDDMVEDYENRHRIEVENLEEEISNIREESQLIEDNLNSHLQELNHELDTKIREENNLRAQLKELKEAMSRKQEEFNHRYEGALVNFRNEKEALNKKNEMLQNDFYRIEKELMAVSHDRSKLQKELSKADASLKELQEEYSMFRQKMISETEALKRALNEKDQEFQNKRIEYEKEIALLKQEKQFNSKKILEQEGELKVIHENHHNFIAKMRQQFDEDLTRMTENSKKEISYYQEKYDNIKKHSKETEMALNRKIAEMNKNMAVDEEKITNFEGIIKALEEKKSMEVEKLQKEYEKLDSSYNSSKLEFSKKLAEISEQRDEEKRQRIHFQTAYDKDTSLLKNKIENEIKMRENLIQSNQETVRQLENRIKNLTESSTSEKTKAELSMQEHRTMIEEKYNTKIYESQQKYQILESQFKEISKKSENEIKDLRERLAIQSQNRESLQMKLQKKESELTETNDRLTKIIDVLKSEKQVRSLEHQKELDSMKERYKLKINDIENSKRNIEKEMSILFMESEKEKARSSQQRQSDNQEIEHLKEKVSKLEKEKTRLDKENERLKVEKRNSKNASYIRYNGGFEERKSAISIHTTRKTTQMQSEKTTQEKKESSEQKGFEGEDKENMLASQNMMLLGDD